MEAVMMSDLFLPPTGSGELTDPGGSRKEGAGAVRGSASIQPKAILTVLKCQGPITLGQALFPAPDCSGEGKPFHLTHRQTHAFKGKSVCDMPLLVRWGSLLSMHM